MERNIFATINKVLDLAPLTELELREALIDVRNAAKHTPADQMWMRWRDLRELALGLDPAAYVAAANRWVGDLVDTVHAATLVALADQDTEEIEIAPPPPGGT